MTVWILVLCLPTCVIVPDQSHLGYSIIPPNANFIADVFMSERECTSVADDIHFLKDNSWVCAKTLTTSAEKP